MATKRRQKTDAYTWGDAFKAFGCGWADTGKKFAGDWADTGASVSRQLFTGDFRKEQEAKRRRERKLRTRRS
ncbi:MAG: hypothetical protein C0605_16160 [Hyphomicrobiales bacterium]|nr:MAG: hypothetical protein C0605_16160 [Hyphomicrobiales bacterium]